MLWRYMSKRREYPRIPQRIRARMYGKDQEKLIPKPIAVAVTKTWFKR
jgi:hypothetical protein